MTTRFDIWLKKIADFCERNNRTLIPILLLVHQIHNGEYDTDASILQLKTATDADHAQAASITKQITKFRGQTLTYRKWIVTQMPYPSAAHFEYLCFGRRLHKRCKWATVGLKKLSIILKHAARQPFRLTQEQFRSFNECITSQASASAALAAIGGIYSHTIRPMGDGKFEFIFSPFESQSWFVEPEQSAETTEEEGTHSSEDEETTHRSNANAARHDIKRFAAWILRTESKRVRQEIRKHWDTSRAQFKQAVTDLVGETTIELFLLETDKL